jgi:small subunit ribosomal protein S8
MDILKREGYVENFKIIDDSKQGLIRIYLRYLGGEPAIKNIKRVSRPGLRIYAKRGNVPLVLKGRGLAMVSTSKGVITDKEAREQHLGGEIIGYIW